MSGRLRPASYKRGKPSRASAYVTLALERVATPPAPCELTGRAVLLLGRDDGTGVILALDAGHLRMLAAAAERLAAVVDGEPPDQPDPGRSLTIDLEPDDADDLEPDAPARGGR